MFKNGLDPRLARRTGYRRETRPPRSNLSALWFRDDAANSQTWRKSRREVLGLPAISSMSGNKGALTRELRRRRLFLDRANLSPAGDRHLESRLKLIQGFTLAHHSRYSFNRPTYQPSSVQYSRVNCFTNRTLTVYVDGVKRGGS